MEGMKQVFNKVMELANTQLTFGNFHFSMFQVCIAYIAISIIVLFLGKIFLDR